MDPSAPNQLGQYAPQQQPALPPYPANNAPQPAANYPQPTAAAVPIGPPQYPGSMPATPTTGDPQQQPAAVAVDPKKTKKQKKKTGPKNNPNSTQNALHIAEIRDGIVIMNDGTYRSVVMAKSVNFDLMSPQEQEGIEYAYQGFLNSLYFPVQIFVRSQRIDMQPYIDKLDKIRTEHDNMLLALLMEDYIGFIDQLSQQTNIMDKKFYLVVPFFPLAESQKSLAQTKSFFSGLGSLFSSKEKHVTIDEVELEKAKTELRNRVQSVLSGLLQCGVQGLPLDTQELIELYYDTYNPDTATRQHLKDFDELTGDVIEKGEGVASQAHLQRELQ